MTARPAWTIEEKLDMLVSVILQQQARPNWGTLALPNGRGSTGAQKILTQLIKDWKEKYPLADGANNGDDADGGDAPGTTPKPKKTRAPRTPKLAKKNANDATNVKGQQADDAEFDEEGEGACAPSSAPVVKKARKPRGVYSSKDAVAPPSVDTTAPHPRKGAGNGATSATITDDDGDGADEVVSGLATLPVKVEKKVDGTVKTGSGEGLIAGGLTAEQKTKHKSPSGPIQVDLEDPIQVGSDTSATVSPVAVRKRKVEVGDDLGDGEVGAEVFPISKKVKEDSGVQAEDRDVDVA